MFSKKKKKVEISAPSNFQHRVHTGFDNSSHKFVGLPKQWASLVTDEAGAQSQHRPSPLVDPSAITPTDIIDLKTVVRGGENEHLLHHPQFQQPHLQQQLRLQQLQQQQLQHPQHHPHPGQVYNVATFVIQGIMTRADRKSQVRQCLDFCTADFQSSLACESAEQKPKHCLT